jgi:hypothetical protein
MIEYVATGKKTLTHRFCEFMNEQCFTKHVITYPLFLLFDGRYPDEDLAVFQANLEKVGFTGVELDREKYVDGVLLTIKGVVPCG